MCQPTSFSLFQLVMGLFQFSYSSFVIYITVFFIIFIYCCWKHSSVLYVVFCWCLHYVLQVLSSRLCFHVTVSCCVNSYLFVFVPIFRVYSFLVQFFFSQFLLLDQVRKEFLSKSELHKPTEHCSSISTTNSSYYYY